MTEPQLCEVLSRRVRGKEVDLDSLKDVRLRPQAFLEGIGRYQAFLLLVIMYDEMGGGLCETETVLIKEIERLWPDESIQKMAKLLHGFNRDRKQVLV